MSDLHVQLLKSRLLGRLSDILAQGMEGNKVVTLLSSLYPLLSIQFNLLFFKKKSNIYRTDLKTPPPPKPPVGRRERPRPKNSECSHEKHTEATGPHGLRETASPVVTRDEQRTLSKHSRRKRVLLRTPL